MQNNTNNIEFEAKEKINQDEYLTLISFFNSKVEDAKKQVSSFFDTQNQDLNNNDITLRVREKEGTYELTSKYDAGNGGRNEINYQLLVDSEREKLMKEGILPECNVKVAITNLGFSGPFIYQGDFETDRIEIPYKGCKVALDYNKYLGVSDYEIEVERDDANANEKEVLKELFVQLNIPYLPSSGSAKRRRFFNQKKKIEE